MFAFTPPSIYTFITNMFKELHRENQTLTALLLPLNAFIFFLLNILTYPYKVYEVLPQRCILSKVISTIYTTLIKK